MNDKIISVQFKDDYIVIETLGRTHSIKRADINQKDKGGFCAQAIAELIKIKETFI